MSAYDLELKIPNCGVIVQPDDALEWANLIEWAVSKGLRPSDLKKSADVKDALGALEDARHALDEIEDCLSDIAKQ